MRDSTWVLRELRTLFATHGDGPNVEALLEARHLCRCLCLDADDLYVGELATELQGRAKELWGDKGGSEAPWLRRKIDKLLGALEACLKTIASAPPTDEGEPSAPHPHP
jgi:hypothetical protein